VRVEHEHSAWRAEDLPSSGHNSKIRTVSLQMGALSADRETDGVAVPVPSSATFQGFPGFPGFATNLWVSGFPAWKAVAERIAGGLVFVGRAVMVAAVLVLLAWVLFQ
jgi:hypothetical protein